MVKKHSKQGQGNKRKTRRNKKDNDPNSPAEVEKRSKFLERNRIAAAKCRQNKKEWVSNLNDRVRELQRSQKSSSRLVESLKEEVLHLKGEMLNHSSCGCPQIKAYLHSLIGDVPSPTSMSSHYQQEAKENYVDTDRQSAGADSLIERDSSASPTGTASTAPTSLSPVNSEPPPEFKLESLLMSELTHDRSDTGTARKLEQDSQRNDEVGEGFLA